MKQNQPILISYFALSLPFILVVIKQLKIITTSVKLMEWKFGESRF